MGWAAYLPTSHRAPHTGALLATGFINSFTSGEIFPNADDRTNIQPIAQGCAQATTLIIQPAGPLKERRAFWWLGEAVSSASLLPLIPFQWCHSRPTGTVLNTLKPFKQIANIILLLSTFLFGSICIELLRCYHVDLCVNDP